MNRLIALLLIVALLAIGNPAAAGPLGVNMGDPIKPSKGWDTFGFGVERRKYEGDLPFEEIILEGTREHGVCSLMALDWEGRSDKDEYDKIYNLLWGKYGKPYNESQKP